MSMNEIRAMREKRVKLWEAAKAFVESRKDANGTLSAEDSATYDQMEADVIRMDRSGRRRNDLRPFRHRYLPDHRL